MPSQTHRIRRTYKLVLATNFKTNSLKPFIQTQHLHTSSQKMAKFSYPKARQTETTETFHKTHTIDNKYDWMEAPDAEETVEFCKAQNVVTHDFLNSYPHRAQLKAGFESANDYEKYGTPFKGSEESPFWYCWYNSGLQNQYILYQLDNAEDKIESGRDFLNPNKIDEKGTTSILGTSMSPDGSIYAYSTSKAGSDWTTVQFRKTTGDFEELSDVLKYVKYSCLCWSKDGAGVFYNGYPGQAGKTDGTETTKAASQKLFYHRLGEDQENDQLIAEYPEEPEWMTHASVSTCGLYLFKDVTRGCERTNKYFYAKLNDDKSIPKTLSWTTISDNFDASYSYEFNMGSRCLIQTNLNAPKDRIIEICLKTGEQKEFIAENEHDVLQGTRVVDNKFLLLEYLKDCKEVQLKFELETGKLIGEVKFPDMGSIVTSSRKYLPYVYFKLIGWINPGALYKWDAHTEEMTLVRQTVVSGFDASKFTTSQIFYPSKDGTKIPMFLVHRKNIKLDGTNPTILYAYGGFNVSLTPSFSPYRPTWCNKMNGVLAIANIRGGGEYGKNWHDNGKNMKKQNCFDDFQAGAEWLIENKYTNSDKLAIQGGSNGGLLVATCFNQRPDLYKAVLCHCPVIDLLRFQRYTIGHAWQSDFNHPDDNEEEFLYNQKYSPLHNVKPAARVPGLMIFTADHDDRVSPHHALKLAAEVQDVHGEKTDEPLMIRVEMDAGHGHGKPMSKTIEEQVDIYSFLGLQMGIDKIE